MSVAQNSKSIDLAAAKSDLLVVLLEGIHASAVEALRHGGYTRIVTHAKALADCELRAALDEASFLGIRSRTQLTEEVLRHANWLAAIGCFCIGTN